MRKRVIPLLLAMVMMFSFSSGITAFAANDSLAPATGNLVIHKYSLEDLSQTLPSTQGVEGTVPASAKPVEGVAFDVYNITVANDQDVPAGTGATYKLITEGTLPTGITALPYLEVTSGSTVTNYNLTKEASQGTTDSSGLLTYGNLDRGFYFVVENLSASSPKINGVSVSIGSTVNPFVVAVPMTNPTGDGWLTDVHVYPKNQPITIVKTVDKSSVSIGDEVTYTITPSVPSDIKDATAYKVTDILDAALIYQTDSVSVKIVGGTNNDTVLNRPNDYTVTYTNGTLEVDFTEAGRTALDGATAVEITFKANVNSGILSKPNHTVENTATLTFTNQYDQTSTVTSDPDTATIHTGQIEITKTDVDAAALSGAKFQIASSEANALAGNYLKKDDLGNIIDFGETGYDAANTWEETSAVTSGLAIFAGIAGYTGVNPSITYNSYWIAETQAPDGFNLFGEPIMVTFDDSANLANVFKMGQTVVNTKGFTLPVTGGLGTLLFTIVGIALVGLAVILVISTRKKKSKANEI